MSKIRKKSPPRKSRPQAGAPVDPAFQRSVENRQRLEHLGNKLSMNDFEMATRFIEADVMQGVLFHLRNWESRKENEYKPNTWAADRHANAMRLINQAGMLALSALAQEPRDKMLQTAASMACASPALLADAKRLLGESLDDFDKFATAVGWEWESDGAA